MLYLWLKFIHIISSTILFGTGIGTAAVMLYAHYQSNLNVKASIYRYVVIADWIFTGSSAVIQPISGFLMIYVAGYSLRLPWIAGSIAGYLVAGICWLVVVYLQVKIRNIAIEATNTNTISSRYNTYFYYWFILGWPAFISLLIVFYLMTFKPVW